METIYVNLDARRITVCEAQKAERACVGQEAVCYTVLPRRRPVATGGKVLDFAACRRALEGEGLERTQPEAERPVPEAEPEPRRRRDLLLAADLIASAGVLAAVIAVAVRFFLG